MTCNGIERKSVQLRTVVLVSVAVACAFAGVPKTETRIDTLIGFEENRGQARPDIRYILRSSLYITDTGYTVSPDQIGVEFIDGNPAPSVSTSDTLPGTINVVRGSDPAKWITGIRHFREVRYRSVYPGIDAVYHVESDRPRLSWIIDPGADPSTIRLRVTGANATLGIDGILILWKTTFWLVSSRAPIAYQGNPPNQSMVEVKWRVVGPSEVQFQAGAYDRCLPLTIETRLPAVRPVPSLSALRVDTSEPVYAAGVVPALVTEAVDRATLREPSHGICGLPPRAPYPCQDAFVARYHASGVLQHVTYVQGSTNEAAERVRTDRDGNVWVAGWTDSSDFPITPDATQVRFAGPAATLQPSGQVGGDLFLMKLDGASGLPLYSTYIGGPKTERLIGLLVDPLGNVYLSGRGREGLLEGLPVTSGAFRTSACERCDFAAKWNSQGRLVYLSYLPTYATTYAVDAAGALYFGGGAQASFPVTPGAYNTSYNGGPTDAYVAKLNATGTALVYATFFGGPGQDYTSSLAVDSQGSVWFTGPTFPPAENPGALAGWQYRYFLAKLDPFGSRLLVRRDGVGGELAVDRTGNVYLFASQGGDRNALNPGGTLTTSCGRSYFAKLDSQGVVQYAEAADLLWGFVGFGARDRPVVATAGSLGQVVLLGLDTSTTPRQWLTCSLSAASLRLPNGVAPGEIITLFGAALGPQTGVGFRLDSEGRVPRELAGTRVLFDGAPVPILYAQHGQVNAIAPFDLAPGSEANIEVEYSGSRAGTLARVVASRPQIFTLNGSGSGQAAALNQDGTINGPQNPASRGSVISLFLTGAGQTSPPLREDEAVWSIDPKPQAEFRLAMPASTFLEVLYVGPSPGLLGSVTQVNVRLPDFIPTVGGFPPLSMPISVEVNGQFLPQDARIAMR